MQEPAHPGHLPAPPGPAPARYRREVGDQPPPHVADAQCVLPRVSSAGRGRSPPPTTRQDFARAPGASHLPADLRLLRAALHRQPRRRPLLLTPMPGSGAPSSRHRHGQPLGVQARSKQVSGGCRAVACTVTTTWWSLRYGRRAVKGLTRYQRSDPSSVVGPARAWRALRESAPRLPCRDG
jgi:hypothetical protein